MAEIADQQHVRLSRGASGDIQALATGTDRSEVALNALTEAIDAKSLSAKQVAQLRDLAEKAQEPKTAEEVLANLRSEGRVHGINTIRGLGFDESRTEPEIPEELIRQVENAAVKSMLVLDDGRSVDDYAKASSASSEWKMWIGDSARNHSSGFVTETHERLEWKVVPMEIADGPETLAQPKSVALGNCQDHYTGHEINLPDARLTAKAIRMHESATGEKLFKGVYTFTNLKNVVVGFANSDSDDFVVHDSSNNDVDVIGYFSVALAPASVSRNQNS